MSRRKSIGFSLHRLIRDFLLKYREDNSYQFSSRKNQSTFMFMLWGLDVLFSVIFSKDRIKSSDGVGSFNKIGSEMLIGSSKERGVFFFKRSGLMLRPDESSEFSNLVIGGERGDIADFRDDAGSINFADTRDRSESVRKRFKFFFNSFIDLFKGLFKSSDVMDELSDDEMIGHSKFGSESIRFPGSRFKALCNFLRIVKSIFTVFDQERDKFFQRGGSNFFRGEKLFKEGKGSCRSNWIERFVLNES